MKSPLDAPVTMLDSLSHTNTPSENSYEIRIKIPKQNYLRAKYNGCPTNTRKRTHQVSFPHFIARGSDSVGQVWAHELALLTSPQMMPMFSQGRFGLYWQRRAPRHPGFERKYPAISLIFCIPFPLEVTANVSAPSG